MLSKLEKIKQRATSKGDSLETSLYYLIKELKCLPDVLGREFEVLYDNKGRITKILQKPMSIPSLFALMAEMDKDFRKQEREAKSKRKK